MVNVIYRTFIDLVYTIPCPHKLILLALLQSNLYCPSLFSIWILCLNLDFKSVKRSFIVIEKKKDIAVIKYPKNGKMRKKVFVWFTIPGYSLSLQESQGIKHLKHCSHYIHFHKPRTMNDWSAGSVQSPRKYPPTYMVSLPTSVNPGKKSLKGMLTDPPLPDNSTLDSPLGWLWTMALLTIKTIHHSRGWANKQWMNE